MGGQQSDWDLLLPHIMAVHRATPHTSTHETPNYMVMGREVRLPDQLTHGLAMEPIQDPCQYAMDLQARLTHVHTLLREQQRDLRSADTEEEPLYRIGDRVWMVNHQRRRGEMPKLQPKYVGPYTIVEVFPNHTYRVEKNGYQTVQSEGRLKPFTACEQEAGRAPPTRESRRPRGRPAPMAPTTSTYPQPTGVWEAPVATNPGPLPGPSWDIPTQTQPVDRDPADWPYLPGQAPGIRAESPRGMITHPEIPLPEPGPVETPPFIQPNPVLSDSVAERSSNNSPVNGPESPAPIPGNSGVRRSGRERNPPKHLQDFVCFRTETTGSPGITGPALAGGRSETKRTRIPAPGAVRGRPTPLMEVKFPDSFVRSDRAQLLRLSFKPHRATPSCNELRPAPGSDAPVVLSASNLADIAMEIQKLRLEASLYSSLSAVDPVCAVSTDRLLGGEQPMEGGSQRGQSPCNKRQRGPCATAPPRRGGSPFGGGAAEQPTHGGGCC